MWKTISSILEKTETGNDSEASGLTAQNVMDFFNKKVESVRQITGGTPVRSGLPAAMSFLNTFHTYTSDEIQKVIMIAPSKSCQLDLLPTHILKVFLSYLLPYITAPCNHSATFEDDDGGSRRHEKLPADLKSDIHIQSYEETSLPANFCLSGRKQTGTNNAVCIPTLPFDGNSSAENSVRDTSCSRSWRFDFSLPIGSVRRFRHGWPRYYYYYYYYYYFFFSFSARQHKACRLKIVI